MNILKNKPLLLAAIDQYELYTKGQKDILKILISLCIDDIVKVGTTYLSEKTGLSRASIYLNLKKFAQEKLIVKTRKAGERHDSYRLNEEKLEYILQLYQNKKAMESD